MSYSKKPEIGTFWHWFFSPRVGADISSSLGLSFTTLASLHSRLVEGKGQDHWHSTLVSLARWYSMATTGCKGGWEIKCFAFIVCGRDQKGKWGGIGCGEGQPTASVQLSN